MASGAGTSSLEKKTLLVGNAGMSSSLQPCDDFDVEKAGAAPVASTLRGGSAYHQVPVLVTGEAVTTAAVNLSDAPSSHFWQALLSCVFCCWPFGLIAIYFSRRTTNMILLNRFQEANEASKKAELWANVAFCTGSALLILRLVLYMAYTPTGTT